MAVQVQGLDLKLNVHDATVRGCVSFQLTRGGVLR